MIILEVSEHSLLVELIGAVLDVHFEMFGRVLQEDVADFADKDVLLPTLFQVGQKSLRALAHRDNVGEKGVAFQPRQQRLAVDITGEFTALNKVRRQHVQRAQVRRL